MERWGQCHWSTQDPAGRIARIKAFKFRPDYRQHSPLSKSNDPPPRINRFLADCGLGSRRSCEAIVNQGRVLVNGQPCLSLSTRILEHDQVTVDGRNLKRQNDEVNILLYKPVGYLCSRNDPEGRPTIFELLPPHLQKRRSIHYAGRLDYNSEGLILLTNSGEITQQLSHPSGKVEKEYVVSLSKPFREEHAQLLTDGLDIPSGFAKAAAVEKVTKRSIAIVLEQGLKRQIRYMLDALNYKVTRLVRVRIGNLTDHSLKPGNWRFIGRRDLSSIFNKTKH